MVSFVVFSSVHPVSYQAVCFLWSFEWYLAEYETGCCYEFRTSLAPSFTHSQWALLIILEHTEVWVCPELELPVPNEV